MVSARQQHSGSSKAQQHAAGAATVQHHHHHSLSPQPKWRRGRGSISGFTVFIFLTLVCLGLLVFNAIRRANSTGDLPFSSGGGVNDDPSHDGLEAAVILRIFSPQTTVSDVLSHYIPPPPRTHSSGFVILMPHDTATTVTVDLQRQLSQAFAPTAVVVTQASADDPSSAIRDAVGFALSKFPSARHVVLASATHAPKQADLVHRLVQESGDRNIASCTTLMAGASAATPHVVVDSGLLGADGVLGGHTVPYITRRLFGLDARDQRIRSANTPVDFVTPHCVAFPRAAADLLIASTQRPVKRPHSTADIANATAVMAGIVTQLRRQVQPYMHEGSKVEPPDHVAAAVTEYTKRMDSRIENTRRQFGLDPLPPPLGRQAAPTIIMVNETIEAFRERALGDLNALLSAEVGLDVLIPDVLSLLGDTALLRFAHMASASGYTLRVVGAQVTLNLWALPPWAQELTSLGYPTMSASILAHPSPYFPHVNLGTLTGSFKGNDDPGQELTVVWDTVCCGCCGFSTEIMHFVLPLQRLRRLRLTVGEDCFCSGFAKYARDAISRATFGTGAIASIVPQHDILVWVSHSPPWSYFHPALLLRRPDYFIGRSMYEFTKIPKEWPNLVHPINEVWVPGQWVRDIFIANGIPETKILVIPEGVDVAFFDPANRGTIALPLEGAHTKWAHFCNRPGNASNYKFFSNFKWEPRKGWDILFEAYFRDFTKDDPVSLYVLTNIVGTVIANVSVIGVQFEQWANRSGVTGNNVSQLAHFCIITESLEESEMADFYNSADAFVLPTRGEGWGLPTIQAMALAKPTISTAWGGQMEFMTQEATFLIELDAIEELPEDSIYGYGLGKKWATPSLDHTAQLMRYVYENRAHAAAVGARARQHVVTHFSEDVVAALANRRFNEVRDWIKHLRRQAKK